MLIQLQFHYKKKHLKKYFSFFDINLQRSSRAQVLLSKNSMMAIKSLVFDKVENLFAVRPNVEEEIPGYQVARESVVCWQARELRQHLQFNLKLDGRPFGGMSQYFD